MELISTSSSELISSIEESDWEEWPTDGKFSTSKLIGHPGFIYETDLRITNSAAEPELSAMLQFQDAPLHTTSAI